MKTEQLLEALVADRAGRGRTVSRSLVGALIAGGAMSLVLFVLALGPRADLGTALASWRFELKVVLVLLAAGSAFALCRDCARPEAPPRALRRLMAPMLLLLAAVATELVVVPRASWGPRLVGTNSLVCLTAIPALSVAPLLAALVVLRRSAPASPALAGAACGLVAATGAAVLYAFHCFDDSPLFVATWYTLASLPAVAIGAVAGGRLLRW